MIPPTLKGRIFVILTFINVGLSSYFAAFEMINQSFVSALTSILCLAIWISECSDKDGD